MFDLFGQFSKTMGWKLRLISEAHKASLNSESHKYSNYFSRIFRYFRLYRDYGFLPDEALKLSLIDYAGEISDCYISKSHMTQRQRILNPSSFQVLSEDKSLFYSYCMHMNIPTPRLLGLFNKGGTGTQWGDGALAGEAQWSNFFENSCPTEFVIKASVGVYGDGIYFIDKTSNFSGVKLFDELNNHPKFNSFVVQECLENHPDLMEINPKKGLQTIRVITHINDRGGVEVVLAYFKPIVGNNRVDNHKSGKTGNLICEVDLLTGTLKQPILINVNGPTAITKHPDTGKLLEGFEMPLWHEVCQTAKATAMKFIPMRTIGWDIAISTDGIRVIEGNARWDPPKFGNFGKNQSVFKD